MKVNLTPAYILHYRHYRETSLLLDILTQQHGKISLIAKGARRRKDASSYHLYQQYLLSFSAKSDLGTLTAIEFAGPMCPLPHQKVIAAYYINEILLRLLRQHAADCQLFNAYHNVLQQLAHGGTEAIVLRYFETALLRAIGYGLVLGHDVVTGEKIIAAQNYFYQFNTGPSRQHSAAEPSNQALGCWVQGLTLQQLEHETLSDPVAIRQAKILLQRILKQHLGDKPLASRNLYKALQQINQ